MLEKHKLLKTTRVLVTDGVGPSRVLHNIFDARFPYFPTFFVNSISSFKWDVER